METSNTPAGVEALIRWHRAMAAEPKRNEAKRLKHTQTADMLETLSGGAQQVAASDYKMLDETPLKEYLAGAVSEDTPMDDWTRGHEECKRRIHRIIKDQQLYTRPPLSAGEAVAWKCSKCGATTGESCNAVGCFANEAASGEAVAQPVPPMAKLLELAAEAGLVRLSDMMKVSTQEALHLFVKAVLALPAPLPASPQVQPVYCNACEQMVTEPCSSVDCSTPEFAPKAVESEQARDAGLTLQQVDDLTADAMIDANLSPKFCIDYAVSLKALGRAIYARASGAPAAAPAVKAP